jgi:hypothetical protein
MKSNINEHTWGLMKFFSGWKGRTICGNRHGEDYTEEWQIGSQTHRGVVFTSHFQVECFNRLVA